MRNIAISDVHGCFRTLESLLFNTLKIDPSDRIFFLGDYIDRGPDSKAVLDLLMSLVANQYSITVLRGNHEQLMLSARKSDEAFDLWMKNSGGATLASFGIRKKNSRKVMDEIPEAFVAFLKSMEYYALHKNVILSHAGLDLSRKNPMKHKKSMIWITEMVYNELFMKDRLLIHGHRCYPLKQLRKTLHEQSHWHYSIDSGCVYDYPGMGYLSALDLDHMELTSIKRIDDVKKRR